MASSCQSLIAALKDCLLYSDCVVKQGHLPSECLRDHYKDLPEECRSLRKATFDCKRGMLDMRKRFRGNIVGSQFEFHPRSENQSQPGSDSLPLVDSHPGQTTPGTTPSDTPPSTPR